MLVSVDGLHLCRGSAGGIEKKGEQNTKKKNGWEGIQRKSDQISVANLLVDFLQVTLFQRSKNLNPKPHSGTLRYHSSYGKGIQSSPGPERLAGAT